MAVSRAGITIRNQTLVVSSTSEVVKETKIASLQNTLATTTVRLLAFKKVSCSKFRTKSLVVLVD